MCIPLDFETKKYIFNQSENKSFFTQLIKIWSILTQIVSIVVIELIITFLE